MDKVKTEVDKQKLLVHFIAEEYFLEHWITQIELDSSYLKTGKRMIKRLQFVQSEIKKLENVKG